MSMPAGYQPLKGSHRSRPLNARRLGAADPTERITARVILRRRTDVLAQADLESYLHTHPLRRTAISQDEHARRFGASQADLDKVVALLESGGLVIDETHAASRTVLATGTVAQFNALFAIALDRFEAPWPSAGRQPSRQSGLQTYRSHEGAVHVPAELADVIIGAFGLDNRRISIPNGTDDPPITSTTSVPVVMKRYTFPTNQATGQTVAIFAMPNTQGTGYAQCDIDKYYADAALNGFTAPIPVPVQDIDGTTNDPTLPDSEVTQDICIASTVAQGATIAVYFNQGNENGWLAALKKATFPQSGDPTPSVLSSSFSYEQGDDAHWLAFSGTPTGYLDAISRAMQDAGGQGLTVCVTSGDCGAGGRVRVDSFQHVAYPASDPWVLACGGTTIGLDSNNNEVEWVWNDSGGATGGGVSAYFARPAWQAGAGVPHSLLNGNVGRGIPDVAGNASAKSGYYPMYTSSHTPSTWTGNGTSAVAPLYAGLLAVINAALGTKVGFINPLLYALGKSVCNDVNPAIVGGPTDNTYEGIQGYPAGAGWDACTGLGTINGNALLNALKAPPILTKQCTLIIDRSTYGKAEVDALLKLSHGRPHPPGTRGPDQAIIAPAFWVVVDGYTPIDLGITALSGDPQFPKPPTPAQLQAWAPAVTMAPPQPSSFQFIPISVASDAPSLPASVQQFTFAYAARFTDGAAFASLMTGQNTSVTLAANLQGSATRSATITLVNEPNPYFANGPTPSLSVDLRVFSILQSDTLFNANLNNGPNDFIQTAIANLTAGKGTTASLDSFEMLPVDEEPNLFVNPTTLVAGTEVRVLNFAIARVRYRSLNTSAANVRVFFVRSRRRRPIPAITSQRPTGA